MKRTLLLFLPILFFGASCQQNFITQSEDDFEWRVISNIETKKVAQYYQDTRYEYLVYRFDPELFIADLHYQKPPLSLLNWYKKTDPTLLINGAFFTESFEPTAKMVINGEEHGTHSYDSENSGYFVIQDGKIELGDEIETVTITPNTDLVQSFPVLLHPEQGVNIEKDSEKIARRTVLAKDEQGRILVIIVDRTPISLYGLAELLLNSDLNVRFALNLDGGPSTGLVLKNGEKEEIIYSSSPLPQVVSFQERPQD